MAAASSSAERKNHDKTACGLYNVLTGILMAVKKNEQKYADSVRLLEQQIGSGEFQRVYLLYGDQAYLRLQNRDKITDAALPGGRGMNYSYFTGAGFTTEEVIDIAQTLPFFADRRVIVIENSWLFEKTGEALDPITDFISRVPETTVLIFSQEEVNRTTKLYKAVSRNGFVLPCTEPDERLCRKLLTDRCKKAGLTLTDEAFSLLSEYAGSDLMNAVNETDKVIGYCLGRTEITMQDVRAVCSERIQDSIFDLIASVMRGDADTSFALYYKMLLLQTPPQQILALMIRQLNQLLEVGELIRQGKPDQEIASVTGLNFYVLTKRIRPLLRGHTLRGLMDALQRCVQADYEYKRGKIGDRLAVEVLIAEITRKTGVHRS